MNLTLRLPWGALSRKLALFGLLAIIRQTPALAAPPPTQCVTPPAGLIAWWPGDDNAINLAGPSDGTLQNGATYVTGELGSAFGLGESSDYVSAPARAALRSDCQLTVMGWFSANAFSPEWQKTLIWKGNTLADTTGSENREYALGINQGDCLPSAMIAQS